MLEGPAQRGTAMQRDLRLGAFGVLVALVLTTLFVFLGGVSTPAHAQGDAEATEDFVTANGIAITGRRDFRGTKTIFIRDPDRNVLELVGPGPSVAELIAEHVHG